MSSPLDKCVHQLFEEQVERTPKAVALIDDGSRLTFRDLNRRANWLARGLGTRGVTPGVPAALCARSSVEMVVGMLAIMKAGGAYVPLDLAHPAERTRAILRDSGAPVIVTQRRLVGTLEPYGLPCIVADPTEEPSGEAEDNLPGFSVDTAVHIIYTSGSTGTPKGVLGSHRGEVNRLRWMHEQYPYSPDELGCLKTSLNFIDAFSELFWPLLQGVPVRIFGEDEARNPRLLVDALSRHGVTRLVLVPSLLRALLDGHPELSEHLPRLRYCMSCGEPLPSPLARRFLERMPRCALINLYGSTETSADVTCYEVKDVGDGDTVPIGRPVANMAVHILDDDLRPVAEGDRGEIYIGGPGVALGYLNRPDLTAERFVSDPFSAQAGRRLFRSGDLGRCLPEGTIEFLGRADHQIKVRGFRIEPGEIEARLRAHSDVQDAAVAACENAPGVKHLVAYVVVRGQQTGREEELARWVGEKLPDYMVPAAFVYLERLPLIQNGKLDRSALPAPHRRRPLSSPVVPPETPAEEAVVDVWRNVLGLDDVGADDDFFDLGGDSLSALDMALAVEGVFGTAVPSESFRQLSPKRLAQLLSGSRAQRVAAPALAEQAQTQEDPPVPSSRKHLERTAFKLPYEQGVDLLRANFKQAALREELYRREVETVTGFLAELRTSTGPEAPTADFLANVLVADTIHRRLADVTDGICVREDFAAALNAAQEPFWSPFAELAVYESGVESLLSRYYTLNGAEALDQPRARGRGAILLTYHSPLFALIVPVLHHLGFAKAEVVAMSTAFRRSFGLSRNQRALLDAAAVEGALAELTYDSHRLLANGGLVVMAGDGRRGRTRFGLPICGRLYPMRAGFAELALRTKAPIVPMTVALDESGRICLTFHDPIEPEGEDGSDRITAMLRKYAAFMEAAWRQAPETLTLLRMERHSDLPRA